MLFSFTMYFLICVVCTAGHKETKKDKIFIAMQPSVEMIQDNNTTRCI